MVRKSNRIDRHTKGLAALLASVSELGLDSCSTCDGVLFGRSH
jgi:hypothetical protein